MIQDIKRFFNEVLLPEDRGGEQDHERGIEHATAALLIELSKSDFEQHNEEVQQIIDTLEELFDLDQKALDELIEWAETATDEAHDLYQFTRLVNEHYDNADKARLLENLWKVAFVDGRIDRYEEQFIRRVAGLLNLPHSVFIKTKISARDSLGLSAGG